MIAGDGPDAPAVTRYAAAHPDVRYLGHVESRTELATAYASADLFVMPGRYETFGMATLEAISSGLPVVGIESSGTATLVPPALGLMTDAGDAGALAACDRRGGGVEAGTTSGRRATGSRRRTSAGTASSTATSSLYREVIDGAPVAGQAPA